MAEFGMDMIVLIADLNGELITEYTVADLLPNAFGQDDLK
jgi:cytidine deaminase